MKGTIITIFLILIFLNAFGMGNKPAMVPIKTCRLTLKDGEMLQYTGYINGEKSYDLYSVAKLENNPVWGDAVRVYEFIQDSNHTRQLPEDYKKYDGYYLVSIDKASLVEEVRDFSGQKDKFRNWPFHQEFKYIPKSMEMEYTAKIWDGYSEKTRKSRIRINPKLENIPFWTMNAIIFVGIRFLDIHSKGVFLAIEPQMLKEPIPAYAKFLSKEVIETKAGKFNTVKCGMSVADPFIGRLLENITKDTYIWIDENSGIVVKIKNFMGEVAYLEMITNHK